MKSPGARPWLALLVPLTRLELRTLLRSWRWRILGLLVLGACFILQRPGPGFGEGAAVDFPGGVTGLRVLASVLAGGAFLLAMEIAGRADRHRMRMLDDARPVPGLVLQSARLLAIFLGVLPLIAVAALYPFVWRFREIASLLLSPSLILMGLTLAPLVLISASIGLAARSVARRDLPALAIGAAVTAAATWHLVWQARAEELFLETSRTLGILLPIGGFVWDAFLMGCASVGFLAIASLSSRRSVSRTPLRSRNPPRPSHSILRRFGGNLSALPSRMLSAHSFLCLLMLAVGVGAAALAVDQGRQSLAGSEDGALALRWDQSTSPPLSDGIVYPPLILDRQWDLRNVDAGVLEGSLRLASSLPAPQPIAAITVGFATRVNSVSRSDGGRVTHLTNATVGGPSLIVLQFDPPLPTNGSVEVRLEAAPFKGATRDWSRTRHHLYRTFETLGTWYGEGILIDYRSQSVNRTIQPSTFTLQMPTLKGLEWICGSADSAAGAAGVEIRQVIPSLPSSLVAAPTIAVERTVGEMIVRFHVFPEHKEIADQILQAWEDRFARLLRAFGPPASPIVFSETPRQVPSSPLSITSATLDRLELALPDYADFSEPTADQFDAVLSQVHRELVAGWIDGSFAGFEDRRLLRDALLTYLNDHGLKRGDTRQLPRLLRRDFILVPWEFSRPAGQFPFEVRASEEPGYRGPALTAFRGTDQRPAPNQRLVAFHHMLRGAVGEEAFIRGLQTLFQEHRGETLTVDLYRQVMEARSQMDLTSFFSQWLMEGVLPRYEIIEAEVLYAEDPVTRGYLYTTRALVANTGDGRMSVPVLLDTDGDRVETTVVLEENEEKEILFTTLERPLSIVLDPRGWIVQMPKIDPETRKAVRPLMFLKRVRQLADASASNLQP